LVLKRMGNSQNRRNREALRQAMEASVAEMPLPFGWEERFTDKGVPYFVDHGRQKTTFQDPRRKGKGIKKPKGKPPKYETTTYDKCQSIVARLHKHTVFSSSPSKEQEQLELFVYRDKIYDDSMKIINGADPYMLTKRLFIKFVGEEGLDYGGMSREWFLCLSQEIFDKSRGLFVKCPLNTTYQVSRFSSSVDNHLDHFRFVGKILGMAVYHGKLLSARFSLPFYKALLGKPLELDDLKHIDENVYKGLKRVIEANNINGWDLTFTICDHDNNGNLVSVNLRTLPADHGGSSHRDDKEKKKSKNQTTTSSDTSTNSIPPQKQNEKETDFTNDPENENEKEKEVKKESSESSTAESSTGNGQQKEKSSDNTTKRKKTLNKKPNHKQWTP